MVDPSRHSGSVRYSWPIDVARFVFALLVVCGHAYEFTRLRAEDWHVAFFDRVLPGGLWVAGFFVMSGWCIAVGRAERGDFVFRRYVEARLSRILPLYVVFFAACLAAEAVFAVVGGRTDDLWWPWFWAIPAQLTMTQGIFGPFGAFNPSWSLTHELVCYLVWGLLLDRVSRHAASPTMLAIGLLPVVVAGIAHALVRSSTSWLILSLPLYFFVWLLGAAAAETPTAWVERHRRRLLAAAVVVAVPLLAYALDRRVPESVGMIAFSMLLALAATQLHRFRGGARIDRVARVLGLASYPLYLGHGIVTVAASVVVAHLPGSVDPRLVMATAIGLSLLLALLVGVPLERRVMIWRAGWLRRRSAGQGGGDAIRDTDMTEDVTSADLASGRMP